MAASSAVSRMGHSRATSGWASTTPTTPGSSASSPAGRVRSTPSSSASSLRRAATQLRARASLTTTSWSPPALVRRM